MDKVSRRSIVHETWGVDCSAWRLLTRPDLAVAEEAMAPGTTEKCHVHRRARQFFYVLSGTLGMEREEGDTVRLEPGEGLEMPPGMAHRAHNPGDRPVRFLVVSAPPTQGDREDLE
ncbi:MAG: cupin domain-containing protein [Hyphomicrobiaceae bacterium]|nr:cupin domain-containing protein [Hyphomicrobiaceae bacterium]